jgi:DNA-binding response OmpR family regulator
MSRVLIVEDDPAILRGLADNLRFESHEVLTATDGETGYRMAREQRPALVVLDLMLPRMSGYDVCKRLRADGVRTPIVMLTARSEEADRILGLDLGADDYVTKPFSVDELLARIRAQIRRSAGQTATSMLRFPGLSIDLERRKVRQEDREVRLTPTEFELLALFAANAGRPFTFDRIIARVWQGSPGTSRDTVRVHVGSLRRKIEPDPSNPRYLVTEPWVGYRFIAEPL